MRIGGCNAAVRRRSRWLGRTDCRDYQPENRTRSWDLSLAEHHERVRPTLAESPSLGPAAPGLLVEAYKLARFGAARQTGLELSVFPKACPWEMKAVVPPEHGR
ncbi:MAG TPA: DUF29 family protein [Bryobacteraceae bacterium]|nr:DUF29 family protein [Bryobacteraceae bacterium]